MTCSIKKLGKSYLFEIKKLLIDNPDIEDEVKGIVTTSATLDPVSPFFDINIPLKQRFDEAIKIKREDQLYHSTFGQILKKVLRNKPVMLVGPSGSGKSFTIGQISELLGIRMYNFGFVADEYASIKGFMDANGNFVKTPFYDLFKYGGICFFDEVDNSESKALMEINKLTGSNGFVPYLFPNGELVTPHPNFRIITAGNTWGDGGNSIYNTREKLDKATLNRFDPIFYDYDPLLEKQFLSNYRAMYDFILAWRKILDKRNYDDVISTRDIIDINEELDSGIFTLEEIFEAKFIKNKRRDTLESILDDLVELLKNNIILDAFSCYLKNHLDEAKVLRKK